MALTVIDLRSDSISEKRMSAMSGGRPSGGGITLSDPCGLTGWGLSFHSWET